MARAILMGLLRGACVGIVLLLLAAAWSDLHAARPLSGAAALALAGALAYGTIAWRGWLR
jgi:hypothetical protein